MKATINNTKPINTCGVVVGIANSPKNKLRTLARINPIIPKWKNISKKCKTSTDF